MIIRIPVYLVESYTKFQMLLSQITQVIYIQNFSVLILVIKYSKNVRDINKSRINNVQCF